MKKISLDRSDGNSVTFNLPANCSDIRFEQLVSFEFAYEKILTFITDNLDTLSEPEKRMEYLMLMCKCVSEFYNVDLEEILQIDISSDLDSEGYFSAKLIADNLKRLTNDTHFAEDSIAGLFEYAARVIREYIPELKKEENYQFEYKGHTYEIPYVKKQLYNERIVWNKPISVQQAVEASQQRLIFSRRLNNSKGTDEDIQNNKNARFTTSLKELALLALRKGEKLPEDEHELEIFLAERAEHFIDIDAATVKDALFFSLSL